MMPLDVMLQQLRSWKADAYAATSDPDVFRADCPVCSGRRTLRLVEMPGGFVKTHCRTGCARGAVGERLAAFELVEDARQACSRAGVSFRDVVAAQDPLRIYVERAA